VEERARVQGILASVWGISAVLGPLAGGLFTQFLTWRWIFFVNLPLGIAAVLVIAAYFREKVEHRTVRTDYLGAALLIVGTGTVVLTLLQAGSAWSWGDPRTLLFGAAGIIIIALFVLRERRAINPIFPLWILGNRVLAGATLTTLVVGLITLGVSAYLPTLAQTVFGATPILAGALLGVMSIAWPLASSISGRIYLKIGFRDTALIGFFLVVAASWIFVLISPKSVVYALAAGTITMGFGLGLVTSPMIVGAQSIVDWGRRGVVTGAVTFGQMLGGTLSTAIFGSVFNSSLVKWFANAPEAIRSSLPAPDHAADITRQASSVPPAVVEYVRTGLFVAIHRVDVGLVGVGLLGLLVILLTPRTFAYIPEPGKVRTGAET
jgi:MFS family permease